jgi:2-polyprenyl-6-methoxyphenol hydroxylase-like FAD-dependent oxidoreductase
MTPSPAPAVKPVLGRRAVVLGAGVAGLLAASVLRDRFAEVAVIDRDPRPAGPDPGEGVPQTHHVDMLPRRGQQALEALLPGALGELVEAGAVRLDSARDLEWLTPAGWAVRFPSSLGALGMSRPLLERVIRGRVAGLPGVRMVEGRKAAWLLPGAGGRIGGVRLAPAPGAPAEEMAADLVVDATGRGSRTPRWLDDLGFDRPAEQRLDAGLVYSTRLYRRPAGNDRWGHVVQAAPPLHNRVAVLLPVEGGRWVLGVAAPADESPGADEDAFDRCLRALPDRRIWEAVRDAEPLGAVHASRSADNRLRRYDGPGRRPSNLLVVGDAACALNPVYGQGTTIAALGALALRRALAERGRWAERRRSGSAPDLARRFARRLAAVQRFPWQLATGYDSRYPGVAAPRASAGQALLRRYLDEVVRLTTESAEARLTLLEVQHLLRPPTALLRPGIALRVTLGAAGRALRRAVGLAAPAEPRLVECFPEA